MSYTGPENELLPGERQIVCPSCDFKKFEDQFTDDETSFDTVCNDCYEEVSETSDCCGASIILTDICSECKEHV
jgi:hypothetical protein